MQRTGLRPAADRQKPLDGDGGAAKILGQRHKALAVVLVLFADFETLGSKERNQKLVRSVLA